MIFTFCGFYPKHLSFSPRAKANTANVVAYKGYIGAIIVEATNVASRLK